MVKKSEMQNVKKGSQEGGRNRKDGREERKKEGRKRGEERRKQKEVGKTERKEGREGKRWREKCLYSLSMIKTFKSRVCFMYTV